jgi:hypothetical protein
MDSVTTYKSTKPDGVCDIQEPSEDVNNGREIAEDRTELQKQVKSLTIELQLKNSRINSLEEQLNEVKQSKKELRLDADAYKIHLDNSLKRIWWMRASIIIILVLLAISVSAYVSRWINAQREVEANHARIEFLRNRQHRTIEEAVELEWRMHHWPPNQLANWDRPSLKYSVLFCNRKVTGRWASAEVAIIYRPNGKASYSDYYLLRRDDNLSWEVIDYANKSPGALSPDIPQDIKAQLGW